MPIVSEDEYRKLHPERLRIYDISVDEYRDARQGDIDLLGAVSRAYGKLREAAKAAQDELQEIFKR